MLSGINECSDYHGDDYGYECEPEVEFRRACLNDGGDCSGNTLD